MDLAALPASLGATVFAWPWMLLAIPLPLLAWWLPPLRRRAGAGLRVPLGDRLERVATEGVAAPGRRFPWLLALAWVALCLAAARPQQLGEPVQPPLEGRELMLALDLSGSMQEPDMVLGGRPVDRLTAAKAVLADFLDRRRGDHVGLLVFGRRAYVLAPLTRDHATVRQQLADSVVGLAGQETAIGDAIGLAVKRLRPGAGAGLQGGPAGRDRVLVLLTDGVNTAGLLDPLKAAGLAADAGVRVHTIAFGGDGTLSIFGFQIPRGGDQIDEATLQAIAAETGGMFFRARDTAELAGIYAEIDRLEPVELPGVAVRPRLERYHWPLALAFGLGLLSLGLGLWRRT